MKKSIIALCLPLLMNVTILASSREEFTLDACSADDGLVELGMSYSSSSTHLPMENQNSEVQNLESLRPYQEEALWAIDGFLEKGNKFGYVKMATGTGKTWTFLSFTKKNPEKKTLIVVPKTNLLEQTIEVIQENAPSLKVNRYDGDVKENCQNILVTTYQSFEKNYNNGAFDNIDMIILDEVHFSLSEKRIEAIDFFKIQGKTILGFTATDSFNAQRLKGSKYHVKELLGEKIFEYTLKQGLDKGYLSPFNIVKLELDEPDLVKNLKKKNTHIFSEENMEQLNVERINEVFPDIILNKVFGKNGLKDKQGMIFTVSKKHAEDISKTLNKKFGETYSAPIHSGFLSKKRKELIARHKNGQIKVLVNVDVLAEGYDNDQVSYLIDFRPTKSNLRMLQVFGRLTRKNPSDPTTKIYIQLILPDSGQNLLEKILQEEGLENIDVFGGSTPKENGKRKNTTEKQNKTKKPKVEIQLEKPAEESAEKKEDMQNKASKKRKISEVVSSQENSSEEEKDVETSQLDETAIIFSSHPSGSTTPELISGNENDVKNDAAIVRAGYTLSMKDVVHIIKAQTIIKARIEELEKESDEDDVDYGYEERLAKRAALLVALAQDPKATREEKVRIIKLLQLHQQDQGALTIWVPIIQGRDLSEVFNLLKKYTAKIKPGPQRETKMKQVQDWWDILLKKTEIIPSSSQGAADLLQAVDNSDGLSDVSEDKGQRTNILTPFSPQDNVLPASNSIDFPTNMNFDIQHTTNDFKKVPEADPIQKDQEIKDLFSRAENNDLYANDRFRALEKILSIDPTKKDRIIEIYFSIAEDNSVDSSYGSNRLEALEKILSIDPTKKERIIEIYFSIAEDNSVRSSHRLKSLEKILSIDPEQKKDPAKKDRIIEIYFSVAKNSFDSSDRLKSLEKILSIDPEQKKDPAKKDRIIEIYFSIAKNSVDSSDRLETLEKILSGGPALEDRVIDVYSSIAKDTKTQSALRMEALYISLLNLEHPIVLTQTQKDNFATAYTSILEVLEFRCVDYIIYSKVLEKIVSLEVIPKAEIIQKFISWVNKAQYFLGKKNSSNSGQAILEKCKFLNRLLDIDQTQATKDAMADIYLENVKRINAKYNVKRLNAKHIWGDVFVPHLKTLLRLGKKEGIEYAINTVRKSSEFHESLKLLKEFLEDPKCTQGNRDRITEILELKQNE